MVSNAGLAVSVFELGGLKLFVATAGVEPRGVVLFEVLRVGETERYSSPWLVETEPGATGLLIRAGCSEPLVSPKIEVVVSCSASGELELRMIDFTETV